MLIFILQHLIGISVRKEVTRVYAIVLRCFEFYCAIGVVITIANAIVAPFISLLQFYFVSVFLCVLFFPSISDRGK